MKSSHGDAELVSSLLPAALEAMGAIGASDAVKAQREQLAAALDVAMGAYVNTALKALLLNGAQPSCLGDFKASGLGNSRFG